MPEVFFFINTQYCCAETIWVHWSVREIDKERKYPQPDDMRNLVVDNLFWQQYLLEMNNFNLFTKRNIIWTNVPRIKVKKADWFSSHKTEKQDYFHFVKQANKKVGCE